MGNTITGDKTGMYVNGKLVPKLAPGSMTIDEPLDANGFPMSVGMGGGPTPFDGTSIMAGGGVAGVTPGAPGMAPGMGGGGQMGYQPTGGSPSYGGGGSPRAGSGGSMQGYSTSTPNYSSGGSSIGGNPSSGYDPSILKNLMAGFQKSTQQANAAGNAQYKNLLRGVNTTNRNMFGPQGGYGQAKAALAGYGQSAMSDINLNNQEQMGSTVQDMASRGLGNTTIQGAMLQGVNRNTERSKLQLQDQIAQQKAGIGVQEADARLRMGQLSADAQLSKQNQGPDQDLYMKLIQQLSQGQAQAGVQQPQQETPGEKYRRENMGQPGHDATGRRIIMDYSKWNASH